MADVSLAKRTVNSEDSQASERESPNEDLNTLGQACNECRRRKARVSTYMTSNLRYNGWKRRLTYLLSVLTGVAYMRSV